MYAIQKYIYILLKYNINNILRRHLSVILLEEEFLFTNKEFQSLCT
jgi:hypothetical protein